LEWVKVKEPRARRIKFVQESDLENNADSIMKRLGKTIKATQRPEKLDIIWKK